MVPGPVPSRTGLLAEWTVRLSKDWTWALEESLSAPPGMTYASVSYQPHTSASPTQVGLSLMKLKWIPVALLGLVSATFAVELASASTVVDQPKPADEVKAKVLKVGSTVPEALALPDFQGNMHNFKNVRGKVAIVHFWSDRCPAERHANPIFKKMEKHYAGNDDVVMIGIASNQNELGKKP